MKRARSLKTGILSIAIIAFLVAAPWPMHSAAGQAKRPSLPKFENIEAAVWQYFQSLGGFFPSALITREQVEPLLGILGKMGFTLADPKTLLDKLPARNEFLAVELYSPGGMKFMRQMARYPQAYDRLDRLSRLPHGKQTVHDLIRGPDGYKMIQYMTMVPGGKEMGKMLSSAPLGADFNQSTGRIYTAPMLLKYLQTQYAAMEKE